MRFRVPYLVLILVARFKFSQCYIEGYKDFSWYEQESFCNSHFNSHLASITSEFEQELMISLLNSTGTIDYDTIIGCTDEIKENNWIWTDGNVFNYTNWSPGEPNGNRSENCCELFNNWSGYAKWNDIPCNNYQHCFSCNMPNIIESTNITHRMYNISINIGNQHSWGIFHFRIINNDSYTEWFQFDRFVDLNSTYTFFPVLENVGDCQQIQIVTTALDDLEITGV